MDDNITFDISGEIFTVKRKTLEKIPGTRLNETGNEVKKSCFERDPQLFRHILNAYRYGLVHVPRDVCPLLFKNELLFWNIPLTMVAPCCWKYLYEVDNDIETVKILIQNDTKFEHDDEIEKAKTSIKATVNVDEHSESQVKFDIDTSKEEENHTNKFGVFWLFLDDPASSIAAKVWFFIYIAIVIVSVITYIIWLDPRVRVSQYLSKNPIGFDIYLNDTVYTYLINTYTEKGVLMVFSDPHPVLFAIDTFCILFFIVETILHYVVCPNKLEYFKNVYHWTKIILCVTMVISLFFEIRKDTFYYKDAFGYLYFAFKSLNVVRLLLIFRLHRIYNRLHVMMLALSNSCKELGLLLFSFLIAVVVYGCLIFSAELESKMFESTYISMWWSLITMTTIGYGDFYPTTSYGYIVGVICALNGIIVLALPIAAIAGTFSNLFSRNTDYQRHTMAAIKQNRLIDKRMEKCSTKDEEQLNEKENIGRFISGIGVSIGDIKNQHDTEKQSDVFNLPTIEC